MSFVFPGSPEAQKGPQKEVSKLKVGDVVVMTRGQEFKIAAIENWEGYLTLTVIDSYGKQSKITKRPDAMVGFKKGKK
jgi:hypothetical protein